MGWTSYHANHYKGKINRKYECDKLWTQTEHNGYPELKVLKSAMRGSTYYAAVQVSRKGVVEGVFGVVTLTSVNSKDYCNFSYKEMDESAGPYESDCPDTILKLLTPTDNKYALEWRERCRENNAKRLAKLTPNQLPIGTAIRFKWGEREKTLIKRAPAYQFKRTWWQVVGEHSYFSTKHIPNKFEIVKEEQA